MKVYCGKCKHERNDYYGIPYCKRNNSYTVYYDCPNYEPKLWVRFINLFKKESKR
jgi:hypothetical protein